MTPTRVLTILLLTSATALPAPAALAQEQPADVAASVYCVYQEPIVIDGVTVYAGGRYCVPGP